MKTSEAEQKVCPFIQEEYIGLDRQRKDHNDTANINCICGNCMAWFITKTHEQIENKPSEADKEKVCMSRYSDGKELSEGDKEGFCIRLSRC